MNRIFAAVFVAIVSASSFGQQNFYLKLLEDGRLAMNEERWESASEYLEIAAFGFLDHPDYLREAYIRSVIVDSRLGRSQRVAQLSFKLRSLFGDSFDAPETLRPLDWDMFLLLSGRTQRPSLRLRKHPDALERFLQQAPDNPEVWAALVDAYRLADRLEEAHSTLQRAMTRFPSEPSLLDVALDLDRQSGRNADADGVARSLLKLDPQHARAHEWLGNRAVEQKRWAQARDHYRHVKTAQFPETAELRRQLDSRTDRQGSTGEDQPAGKDAKKRIDQIERALRQDEDNAALTASLVTAYIDAGMLKKAGKTLRVWGSRDASNPQYVALYARYNYVGKNYQANLSLESLDQRNDDANYYLAKSYLELGLLDRARILLERLPQSRYPDLAHIRAKLESLSQLLAEGESNLKQRQTTLEQLDARAEASFLERATLAEIYVVTNQWEAARELITDLRKDHSREPEAQYLSARLSLYDGDYKQAARLFGNLANAGFHGKEVFYYGGLAYFKDGQDEVADYMFSRALKNGTAFEREISRLRQQ